MCIAKPRENQIKGSNRNKGKTNEETKNRETKEMIKKQTIMTPSPKMKNRKKNWISRSLNSDRQLTG